MGSSNTVPAVISAARILELLSRENFRQATSTEISTELELNKSTCYRILRTLQGEGYVQMDERTKDYSLGTQLIFLGERAKEHTDYIEVVRGIIQELEMPGVTFVVTKRTRGDKLMYVAKKEPKLPIRLAISSDTFPIPFGSIGKCFFAFLSEEEQVRILQQISLNGEMPRYTEKSIVSVDAFKQEVEKIQQNKLAESYEEYFPGLITLAVPIFYKGTHIVLSLGAYMFRANSKVGDFEELKEMLRRTALKIEKAIAYLRIEGWINDIGE